jgi:hypothetical protein
MHHRKCPDIAVAAALLLPCHHLPNNAAAAKALPFFVYNGKAGKGKNYLAKRGPRTLFF